MCTKLTCYKNNIESIISLNVICKCISRGCKCGEKDVVGWTCLWHSCLHAGCLLHIISINANVCTTMVNIETRLWKHHQIIVRQPLILSTLLTCSNMCKHFEGCLYEDIVALMYCTEIHKIRLLYHFEFTISPCGLM